MTQELNKKEITINYLRERYSDILNKHLLYMNGDRRTWNGNPESNSGWEHWIDPAYGNIWGKSKLEFKFVC